MTGQVRSSGSSVGATIVIVSVVFACSIYANMAFFVGPAYHKYFPPFKAYRNVNANKHLGGEYYQMAQALVAGQGFAHPFDRPTGPTAWQPPVLPLLLAGLLWLAEGSRDAVVAVVVFLQMWVLVVTGLLVLALTRQTAFRIGAIGATSLFLLALLHNFWLCFQFTHDGWIVMLALDGVIAGLCWLRPLRSARLAAGWGLYGGLCAMINPIVGFTWGVLTFGLVCQHGSWRRLAAVALGAALVLAPWTIRNYLVFGRLIPSKSNLYYEMYQSQCLQKRGMLQSKTFAQHPYGSTRKERKEYVQLGEAAFLDRKWEQFCAAVQADPLDYADRVAERFIGATLWYEPFQAEHEPAWPGILWMNRLLHALPFLALLVLLLASHFEPLHWRQWVVIGAYVLYLLPYVFTSYYERYGLPLLGVKTLLVIWAGDWLLCLAWRPEVVEVDEPLLICEEVIDEPILADDDRRPVDRTGA